MKNILEAFAHDHLHPNARCFKRNSDYHRAIHRISDAEQALLETLNEQQRALLEDFTDARDDVFCLEQTDQFIYAYRLGVLMMVEVFCASDEMITGGE